MYARCILAAALFIAVNAQTPAVDEVLPGVWRVGGSTWGIKGFPTVSAHQDANVYVMQVPQGLLLVDCATVEGMPLVERNIRSAGFAPEKIGDLIIPHSHADHTEAAELWRTRYAVKTHLSEIAAEHLDRKDSSLLGYVGGDSRLRYIPFKVDHRVKDGEVFEAAGTKIAATFVPGHTLDSTLFTLEHHGKVIGLSGDFVFGPADWNPEGGGLGSMQPLWKASLSDYRDSLKKVLGLKIDVLLPGHGRIISGRDTVQKELETALAAIERFLATPKIYVFGIHRPQFALWLKKNK